MSKESYEAAYGQHRDTRKDVRSQSAPHSKRYNDLTQLGLRVVEILRAGYKLGPNELPTCSDIGLANLRRIYGAASSLGLLDESKEEKT